MGQRLVVDVKKGESTFAKVYFHWSAYSVSAMYELQKLVKILEGMRIVDEVFAFDRDENNKPVVSFRAITVETRRVEDPRLRLIYGLAEYGGGLEPDDLEYAKKLWPHLDLPIAKSRNEGMVAISEEQMQQFSTYAEGDASVDLESRTAGNWCFWHEEEVDDKQTVVDSPYDFGDIPFDKLEEATKWLENCRESYIRYDDECMSMIE